jgi:hypothetical protein
MRAALERLLAPTHLHAWPELADHATLPPRCPGTYGWYFDTHALPAIVPVAQCHRIEPSWVLLYVGIAPAKPAPDRAPSKKTLRSRLRFHFRGNARGSTLRLTLGCLLAETLGIDLVQVGTGRGFAFGSGEAKLSAWMAEHARVCWVEHQQPWELEDYAIATLDLPLNLAGNRRQAFHATLSELRRAARERSRR